MSVAQDQNGCRYLQVRAAGGFLAASLAAGP
jgi:hypothetical protein